jgi:hypothetical protein
MDKIVLSLDDLTVDSFTASSNEMVIGDHHTGCIDPCQNQFSEGGYC